MPFTLAHPAAAVPLARKGFVLSALVVGSMLPDFGYFLRLGTDRSVDHSIPFILYFGIPAGLATLWIYHVFLKRPLLSLLPAGQQQRLAAPAAAFTFRPLARFLLIILSLVLGALTHLAWDSFTHAGGWGVQHVPMLSATLVRVGGTSFQVYKILQYGSGVLGVGLLIYWYLRWVSRLPVQNAPAGGITATVRTAIVSLMALSTLAAGVLYATHRMRFATGFHAAQVFASRAVWMGVWVLVVEVMAFSVIWHIAERRRR
jgi:hypothetical protein